MLKGWIVRHWGPGLVFALCGLLFAVGPGAAWASTYDPGPWNGSTTAYEAGVGDSCSVLNPTCHAQSSMTNGGSFRADAGFSVGAAANVMMGTPSFASTGRTLLQHTALRVSDFCNLDGYPNPRPTVTVNLTDLHASFTSDGQSDEMATADLWVSLGFVDAKSGSLVTVAGDRNFESAEPLWLQRYPLVAVNGAAQSASSAHQAQIVWPAFLDGNWCRDYPGNDKQVVDVVVAVTTTFSRGRELAGACAFCAGSNSVGLFLYNLNPNPDDLNVSGTISNISVT